MTELHFQGTVDVFSTINDESTIFQGTVDVFSAINDDSTIFHGTLVHMFSEDQDYDSTTFSGYC